MDSVDAVHLSAAWEWMTRTFLNSNKEYIRLSDQDHKTLAHHLSKMDEVINKYSKSRTEWDRLPARVSTQPCPTCGAEVFLARGLGKGDMVAFCPTPIKDLSFFVLDSRSVSFEAEIPAVVRGRLGTMWLSHDGICGKPRPDEGPYRLAWDDAYSEMEAEQARIKEDLEHYLDD